MDQLEFMELIGRVANCHFSELEIPLPEKINKVLDEWFILVGELR